MAVHSRRNRKRMMSEINVVPYIDVMLVLLVIFMITTPLLTEGVNVDLPSAKAKTVDTEQQEPFVVTVDAGGNYYLNDNKNVVTNPGEMRVRAAAVLRHNPKTPFLVRGDRAVPYEKVVQAMVLLQQAGVPQIGLVTETPQAN